MLLVCLLDLGAAGLQHTASSLGTSLWAALRSERALTETVPSALPEQRRCGLPLANGRGIGGDGVDPELVRPRIGQWARNTRSQRPGGAPP